MNTFRIILAIAGSFFAAFAVSMALVLGVLYMYGSTPWNLVESAPGQLRPLLITGVLGALFYIMGKPALDD